LSNNNLSITANNSYSQALYELSEEDNSTSEIENQVNAVLKLINSSKDFKVLIKNPTNKQSELLSVVKAISEKFKLSNLFSRYLSFLIIKRKFFFVEKILRDFLLICSNKRGEIEAKLKSAKELSGNEIENIKKELSNNFNSKINLNYEYDENLIGGLIIKVGSIMIDSSIQSKLKKIENQMIEA
tara:strand:- start:30 stop:584 length:555 start_codon:yes stop_codon:yes gene_type:complete